MRNSLRLAVVYYNVHFFYFIRYRTSRSLYFIASQSLVLYLISWTKQLIHIIKYKTYLHKLTPLFYRVRRNNKTASPTYLLSSHHASWDLDSANEAYGPVTYFIRYCLRRYPSGRYHITHTLFSTKAVTQLLQQKPSFFRS